MRHSWRAARYSAERFEEAFWCEELGTYALALDGAKQPCRVRASNAGQLVYRHRQNRARRRVARSDASKFFSGWGIRTVARGEARYNPMSYHDGSIWPHDNALIALGFARYGLKHRWRICSRACSTPRAMWTCGGCRSVLRIPARKAARAGALSVACAPQAWASATPFTLLESARSRIRCRARRDPAARSAPAGVPQRGAVARPAARAFQCRLGTGSPPRR